MATRTRYRHSHGAELDAPYKRRSSPVISKIDNLIHLYLPTKGRDSARLKCFFGWRLRDFGVNHLVIDGLSDMTKICVGPVGYVRLSIIKRQKMSG